MSNSSYIQTDQKIILMENYFYGLKNSIENNPGLLLQTGP